MKRSNKESVCFFVGDMEQGGGTEHMTQLIANSLSKNPKRKIYVLSKSGSNRSTSYYGLEKEVQFDVLDCEKYKGISSVIKEILMLAQFVRNNRIDVLISVDVSLAIFSLPIKLLCPKLKQIFWDHFCVEYTNENKRMTFFREMALIFGNAYIVLTPEDAEIIKKGKKFLSKVYSIPNICPYEISSGEYNDKSKEIISVGNVIPVKGFDIAIEIAELILPKNPEWTWIIYGSGSEMEHLKSLLLDKHLEKQMKFAGRIKDMESVYNSASFLVMTSRSEGFGLVLAEAQAHHLPTVAFDVPFGPRNIILDGINGVLVKPFDVEGMATRIGELINSDDRRQEFSEHATDLLHKMTAEEVIKQWGVVLEEL